MRVNNMKPKPHVFVVYDEKNRVIDIYANQTWASRKANTSKNYRVETYVHENNRYAIKMAEHMTREEGVY